MESQSPNQPFSGKGAMRLALACSLVVGFLMGGRQEASAQPSTQAFELTLVTSQPKAQWDNRWLPVFSELIEARSKGRLKIKILGGPEVVPPLEGLEYLKRGAMDMAHVVPTYFAGTVPELSVVEAWQEKPEKYRTSGAFDLMNDLLLKKHGIRNLGYLQWFGPYVIISNKKIDKASLAGLRIRAIPGLIKAATDALGAASVIIPPGELYTALERGVVDGSTWPLMPIRTWKLQEVSRYLVWPPFTKGGWYMLLIRESVWGKLPGDLQKVLSETIIQMENEIYMSGLGAVEAEIESFKGGKMTVVRLSDAEAAKYVRMTNQAMWSELKKRSPELGPKLEAMGGGGK